MDSSRTPDRETTPDIHHYIADKLNSAIFSGWYTERIWIEGVQQYRDQIKVDEDEVQMNKILRSVSRRVKKLHPKFTGIDGKSRILNTFSEVHFSYYLLRHLSTKYDHIMIFFKLQNV